MSAIKKIKIGDVIYEANVDFRNVLKANEIATDESINGVERAYAICYTIFGDKGLDNNDHINILLKWFKDYVTNGKEVEASGEPDMDYIQDMDYIEASFMSDYNIDLETTDMEWRKFYNLMNGLSNSEIGNCCVLNRVRNLRNYDLNTIKDPKERNKIREAQEKVALKKKKPQMTEEQKRSSEEFIKNFL